MKKLNLGAGSRAKQVEEPAAAAPKAEAAKAPVKKSNVIDVEAVAVVDDTVQAKFIKHKGNGTPHPVQRFELTGVSTRKPVFSTYPFAELEEGEDVTLIHDPYGAGRKDQVVKHKDPTAVSVLDSKGRHIGYIKKEVAAVVHKGLASGKFQYQAFVSAVKGGIDDGTGEPPLWGVHIIVKFFKQ